MREIQSQAVRRPIKAMALGCPLYPAWLASREQGLSHLQRQQRPDLWHHELNANECGGIITYLLDEKQT